MALAAVELESEDRSATTGVMETETAGAEVLVRWSKRFKKRASLRAAPVL